MTTHKHRLLILAAALALLLTLTAATPAQASKLAGADDYEWQYYFSSGSCPGEYAQRNKGQHGWELMDRIAPTCTEAGYGLYECVYCQSHMEVRPAALGHDWTEWDRIGNNGVSPTASQCGGYMEIRYCMRCGLQEVRTVQGTHQFGDWKVDEKATCTEQGLEKRTCARCGEEEWRYTAPLGHEWAPGQLISEATCAVEGKRTTTCARCGAVQDEIIPKDAFAHKWDEGKVTTPAGCETDGEITYTCLNDSAHTKKESIPATGHQWETIPGKPATCEEPGLEAGRKCALCGLTEQEEIPPLGHDWDQGIVLNSRRVLTERTKLYTCRNNSEHFKTETLPALSLGWSTQDIFDHLRTPRKPDPLEIVTQPKGGYIDKGGSITLSVEAQGGTQPYTYQWQRAKRLDIIFDGSIHYWYVTWSDIDGATESTYPAKEGDYGYKCIVTDAKGASVTSKRAVVYYNLYVTTQPKDGYLWDSAGNAGKEVKLTANADGGKPSQFGYTITWYKVGSGADTKLKSSSSSIDRTLPVKEPGQYYCVFTDTNGHQVTSNKVKVEKIKYVDASLKFVTKNGSTYVEATITGGVPPFHVVWNVATSPAYIFWEDLKEEKGVTSRTVSIPVSKYGVYGFHVYDSANCSNYAEITYRNKNSSFAISKQPVDTKLNREGEATVSITVKNGKAPYYVELEHNGLFYDWIDETNSSTITFTVYDEGYYTFYVTDAQFAQVKSRNVKVSPNDYKPVSVKANQTTYYVPSMGGSTTIGVTASNGTPPYTYTWYHWKSDRELGDEGTIYFTSGRFEKVTGSDAYKKDLPVSTSIYEPHSLYYCVVKDKAGDTAVTKYIYVYSSGQPYVIFQPTSIWATNQTESKYISCRATPPLSYDQRTLTYQWQQKTSSGWINWGQPITGQNSVRWQCTLTITGAMWGHEYRCKITSTKTGSSAYTYSVKASCDIRVSLDISIVGDAVKTNKCYLTAEITGGCPPYQILARGYADIPTTYDETWFVKDWHYGYTYWATAKPFSWTYDMGANGVYGAGTFKFTAVQCYKLYFGGGKNYIPFYCHLSEPFEAPMHWRIEVTDAAGNKYYSPYYEVKW